MLSLLCTQAFSCSCFFCEWLSLTFAHPPPCIGTFTSNLFTLAYPGLLSSLHYDVTACKRGTESIGTVCAVLALIPTLSLVSSRCAVSMLMRWNALLNRSAEDFIYILEMCCLSAQQSQSKAAYTVSIQLRPTEKWVHPSQSATWCAPFISFSIP